MQVTLSHPTTWDAGATGPANRRGLAVEAATEFDAETGRETPNPNGVNRVRRVIWVDRYENKGGLTRAQCDAAHNLYMAYHGRPNRDPLAAMGDKVDGRGDFDPLISDIDRKREYFSMKARVPAGLWPFIEHVVLLDLSISSMPGGRSNDAAARYLERLRAGLDALC